MPLSMPMPSAGFSGLFPQQQMPNPYELLLQRLSMPGTSYGPAEAAHLPIPVARMMSPTERSQVGAPDTTGGLGTSQQIVPPPVVSGTPPPQSSDQASPGGTGIQSPPGPYGYGLIPWMLASDRAIGGRDNSREGSGPREMSGSSGKEADTV